MKQDGETAEYPMGKKALKPPKKTSADRTHGITKAVIAAVPYVGGSAAELFQLAIAPPIESRRDEWMESVFEKLQELEATIDEFSLAALRNNEEFITIIIQATRTALGTHHEEKRDALRAAVVNVAVGAAPEDYLQQVFIRYIDELTPLHISMLRFFHDPGQYFVSCGKEPPSMSVGGIGNLLESAMPHLRGRRDIYDQVGRDLENRGLLSGANFHVTMTAHGLFQKKTTSAGDEFLRFITLP